MRSCQVTLLPTTGPNPSPQPPGCLLPGLAQHRPQWRRGGFPPAQPACTACGAAVAGDRRGAPDQWRPSTNDTQTDIHTTRQLKRVERGEKQKQGTKKKRNSVRYGDHECQPRTAKGWTSYRDADGAGQGTMDRRAAEGQLHTGAEWF